jgi:50S ribosomal subunit-associated GTPase HflX
MKPSKCEDWQSLIISLISGADQQRKKRVSFNEQVLARIYRSNSSIIATKNKQERKIRNRMRRRAESESSDQSPISVEELIHVPILPLSKVSAEEKIDESAPNCDDAQGNLNSEVG